MHGHIVIDHVIELQVIVAVFIYLFIIITESTSQAKALFTQEGGGTFMQLQLINLILKLFNRGNFFDVIR